MDTKTTIQNQKTQTVEIFFTDRAVKSSEAYAAVPEGCRMARLDEIALAYKERPGFKEELDYPVWVDQKGLNSKGYHKIDENGKSVKIKGPEFKTLEAKDRSWHTPGTSLVTIQANSGYWDGRARLDVDADAMPDSAAQVAYIALDTNARLAPIASLARK